MVLDELEKEVDITVDGEVSVIFVGDPHCNMNAPSTRIDDYVEATMNKLSQIADIAACKKSPAVIFLGDIFHKPRQNEEYHVKLFRVLEKFHSLGVRTFTIIGNHDLIRDRLDSLERTSLGMFIEMGIIEAFRKINIKVGKRILSINACHYSEEFPDVKKVGFSDYNVLCAHVFYNYGLPKDNLSKEQVINLGYNMYVLGHDHILYDTEDYQGRCIVRPGSMMRGTSHQYHLVREVSVDVLRYDGEIAHIERCPLKVSPASEVFSAAVTDKADLKGLSSEIQSQFTELITMLTTTVSDGSQVYEVIDRINIEPRIKERIETYLRDAGILRMEVGKVE